MSELVLYVIGDGDRIGDRVESLLFAEDFAALKRFSRAVTAATHELGRAAAAMMGAEVIVAGGDDLVFLVAERRFDEGMLDRLAAAFRRRTGCGISFGVGYDVESAYLNLRRAKSGGGSAIVVPE